MLPCIFLRRTPSRDIYLAVYHSVKVTIRTYATNEAPSPRKDILTVLHRATALSNILPSLESSSWSKLIGTTINQLSSANIRKPRIAVWGSDEHSGSTELISALLDDPLVSDQGHIDALRNRRQVCTDNVLTIRYGEFEVSAASLRLNLSWLQKFDVDIIEIPTTHPDFMTLLHDADIRIISVGPLSAPLPRGLESLLLDPASFLVFRYSTSDHQAADASLGRLLPLSPALSGALKNRILTVYPPCALSALDTFRQASKSATAIQAFQTDFLSSGVSTFSQSISRALSINEKDQELHRAKVVLCGALEACRNSVEDARRDIAAVQNHIDELRVQIDESYTRSMADVLGGQKVSEVGEAIQISTREMRSTVDALKWWKLPVKVDDLGEIFYHAASRTWCRDLEAKLHFQAGRLSVVRAALTAKTNATLSLLPSPYQSAVLVNTLRQISARPPDLSPTTLTYPLMHRLQQLQYPILSLHRHAQRVLLVAVTTAFVSAGGSYSAWLLGWVAPSTAFGIGALGIMAGMRWLVGRWERTKNRWWRDWHRVGQGLERDLKDALAVVMQGKVTVVPSTVAAELSKMVAGRLSELEGIEAELESLEKSSRSLYPQGPKSID